MAIEIELKVGKQGEVLDRGLRTLRDVNFLERIFKRDGSLWSSDPRHKSIAESRLGWLELPATMLEKVDHVESFVQEKCYGQYKYAVHLGMGGSSLAPEVLFLTFRSLQGFPELIVLDSTDPDQIYDVVNQIDLSSAIFIVASKSGTTVETDSLARFFYEKIKEACPASCREHFIAITDPGTQLQEYSDQNYLRTFVNPPDIGGRYSALSYFGLVPFALMGHDLKRFLGRSYDVQTSCKSGSWFDCPGVKVGALLGSLALQGIDKLTLQVSPSIQSLGSWIEQLIAESTGKDGKGILPVVNEQLTTPEFYSSDRVFVYISVRSEVEVEKERKLLALESRGYPIIKIVLDDIYDLSSVFYTWEIATAAAAVIIGIDPFDEPNVQESKDNTKKILKEFQLTGRMSIDNKPLFKNRIIIFGNVEAKPFAYEKDVIRALFQKKREGDYLAITAYLPRRNHLETKFQRLQAIIRDKLQIPVTVGFGPRYLHSTGQFHKGGNPKGLFMQLTHSPEQEMSIPGEDYTFADLFQAQAIGDYNALKSKGKPILSIQLGKDYEHELTKLIDEVAVI
ncbi:MAG: glucose-6-phosphate isomerase [Candidatus Kryptoniota bacterium]